MDAKQFVTPSSLSLRERFCSSLDVMQFPLPLGERVRVRGKYFRYPL
jgi:hypothetical protein